ncbi:MAG TPA: Spy/CpxP family protein refolding chaperone [Acetobacteraceae bacterium]|nr:Spy/CpxP family protein refolding chaperone [Acetobacteraceae bacterium]
MNRIDRVTSSALLALALAAGGLSAASAQTTDDQATHHEDEDSGAMPMSGQGGGMSMMQGKEGGYEAGWAKLRMMSMMHERMGLIPLEHVEGHIAFLKAELGITDAQLPQWNAFADALRTQSAAALKRREEMMKTGMPATPPDRLARMEQMMSARLDALKAIEGPVRALYTALSPEQQKKADELMCRPMGGM